MPRINLDYYVERLDRQFKAALKECKLEKVPKKSGQIQECYANLVPTYPYKAVQGVDYKPVDEKFAPTGAVLYAARRMTPTVIDSTVDDVRKCLRLITFEFHSL